MTRWNVVAWKDPMDLRHAEDLTARGVQEKVRALLTWGAFLISISKVEDGP